ncbi:pyridoxamine 5'-phosphate oxidase family protein [Intestinimonas sp. HCP28S3_D6]|uniref:pyridoxamine 5'-phosphate oxidase family protein n=1 Tax=Intestinimonas sp. HCP28S3_D6 TaxID=3438942 RepID=UPI003F8CE9AA
MFREMRRKNQVLSHEECLAVLDRGTSGVLAVQGDNGYPYAVPLSYVYENGKLWFHCAREGHKLDAILRDPKVSFCVVDRDQVVPLEYTTYFRSVVLFGKARVLEDPTEIRAALEKLALRYAPEDSEAHREAILEKELPAVVMVEVTVEHLSGKEAIELVRSRHALE